jgi:hypothetical protein
MDGKGMVFRNIYLPAARKPVGYTPVRRWHHDPLE